MSMVSIRTNLRGHEIEINDNKDWVYGDTRESVTRKRACKYCDQLETEEGHDNCVGTLPNVLNACCRRGIIEMAYIQLKHRTTVREKEAMMILKELKNRNKPSFE